MLEHRTSDARITGCIREGSPNSLSIVCTACTGQDRTLLKNILPVLNTAQSFSLLYQVSEHNRKHKKIVIADRTPEIKWMVYELFKQISSKVLGYRLSKCMKEGHMASIRGSQSSSQPEPGLGS